jgi:hypothetical protein
VPGGSFAALPGPRQSGCCAWRHQRDIVCKEVTSLTRTLRNGGFHDPQGESDLARHGARR